MKKRITAFMFLIVMLVGMLGTVSVQASDGEQYRYNSLATYHDITSVMNAYKGLINSGLDSESSVAGTINTTFSVSTSNYWVLGAHNLQYNTIDYYVISPESFTISADSYYRITVSEYDPENHILPSSVFEDEGDGVFSCTSSYDDVECSRYHSYYYSVIPSAYVSFSGVKYDLALGGWYVFDIPEGWKSIYYLIDEIIANYSDDLSQAPGVSIDESNDISGGNDVVYDSGLGYLQNIMCTTLVDKTNVTNTSNEYAGEKRYKFSYGLTTSTGFDLRSDGADVQYCIKIKGGYTTLLNDYVSLPTVVSDYYKAGNGASYFYIDSDTFNDLYTQFRTDASLMAKTIDSQIYIYMRPVSSTGFGGWSRLTFDKGNIQVSNLHIDNGTTSDGDISSEADGEEDDFNVESSTESNSAYGEGNGFDDAESNASVSGTNSSNTNFDDYDAEAMFSNITSLVSQIGQIPMIVADIFSFLPGWCLALVAIGFSLVVFLIIYKLVRG